MSTFSSDSWRRTAQDGALLGYACGSDCIGYCSCSPCITCGEMGRYTNFVEGEGAQCDSCWRKDCRAAGLLDDEDDDYGEAY